MKLIDWLILILLLIICSLIFLGRWQGHIPFVQTYADELQSLVFSHVVKHPEYYSKDFLYSEIDSVRPFYTFRVILNEILFHIIGDYGLASFIVFPFSLFFYLFGNYLLGIKVFNNRILGIIFMATMFNSIPLKQATILGIDDGMARSLYLAFVPFILIAFWNIKDQPQKWFLLSIITGFALYFHPISGIVCAIGFFFALFPYIFEKQTDIIKRGGFFLSSGILFLIIIAPYILIYFSNHAARIPMNEHDFLSLRNALDNMPWGNTPDLNRALNNWFVLFFDRYILLLVTITFGSIFSIYRIEKGRIHIFSFIALLSGMAFITFLIPTSFYIIEHFYQRPPFQISLLRGGSFIFYFMCVLAFYINGLLMCHFSQKKYVSIFAIIVTIFLSLYIVNMSFDSRKLSDSIRGIKYISHIFKGHPPVRSSNYAMIIREINEHVEYGSLFAILPTRHTSILAQVIRLYCNQSLAYHYKDSGTIIYTDPYKFIKLYELFNQEAVALTKFIKHKDYKYLIFYLNSLNVEYAFIPEENNFKNKPECFLNIRYRDLYLVKIDSSFVK